MIQRVQTIYYVLALVAITLPLFGLELFSFTFKEFTVQVTICGDEVFQKIRVADLAESTCSLLYISNIILSLLLLATIFSYKKLKRQSQLGNLVFGLYLLSAAGLFLMNFLRSFEAEKPAFSVGIGFYIFAIGIIFVYLGNRGVRKDRKLLDSLNRLR